MEDQVISLSFRAALKLGVLPKIFPSPLNRNLNFVVGIVGHHHGVKLDQKHKAEINFEGVLGVGRRGGGVRRAGYREIFRSRPIDWVFSTDGGVALP